MITDKPKIVYNLRLDYVEFFLPFSYSAANIFTLIISLNRGNIKQTETSDYMKGALL